MTFIPADSLTFHCRKCSGTINESNFSSSVGSDPFRRSLSRDVVASKSPHRSRPAGTLSGGRPLLTLLVTPVLFQRRKVKCLAWRTSLQIVYTAAVGANVSTVGFAHTCAKVRLRLHLQAANSDSLLFCAYHLLVGAPELCTHLQE